MAIEACLQIDGWQYLVATGGVTTFPTCAETDWIGSTGVTLLPGFLVPPANQWTERVNPIDGELSLDTQSFKVFDADPEAGPASGHPLMTFSGTLSASVFTTTTLTGAGCVPGDVTLNVADTTLFASSGTLWIGTEAITYTGKTGSTFTGCTRGALGTAALFHLSDIGNGYYPVVQDRFPSFEGKRATLYKVDDSTNVAVPIWRGYCNRAPRFIDVPDQPGSFGAAMELQCEDFWRNSREARASIPGATVRLRGVHKLLMGFRVSFAADPDTGEFFDAGIRDITNPTRVGSDVVGVLNDQCISANDRWATAGVTMAASCRADGTGASVTVTGNVAGPFALRLKVGDEDVTVNYTGSGTGTITARVNSIPQVIERLYLKNADAVALISGGNATGTAGGLVLPSAWTASTITDGPLVTTSQPVMVGDFDDDYQLLIKPTSVTAFNSSTAPTGPYINGEFSLIPKSPGTPSLVQPRGPYWVVNTYRAIALDVAALVQSSHWLLAMRRGLIEDVANIARPEIDSRDWEFSQQNSILACTAGDISNRFYILDGSKTVGSLFYDNLRAAGCAIGVRNSRLSPFAIRAPLPSDVIDANHTFDASTDWVANASFERSPDGIVNMAKVNAVKFAEIVNDRGSIDRFGQGRMVELAMFGWDPIRNMTADPTVIWSQLLSRMIDLWGYPTFSGKFSTTLERFDSVFIGDIIQVTDWLIPDGNGDRAPVNRRGLVIGKSWNLDAGTLVFEAVFFDIGNIAGYAPCVKINVITINELSVETGYLSSTNTDYSGSNLAEYAFASTFPNDGGASWFAVGDKVRLVKFGAGTTVVQETGHTIALVDPGALQINLVAPVAMTIAAGDVVHLVYDAYGSGASVSAANKLFAWVSSQTTHEIGTSADAQKTWAP